ncbi:LOW QUALITY PROTEIN: hypothetical protein V3C99_003657, partial [Haemonchus contortus]
IPLLVLCSVVFSANAINMDQVPTIDSFALISDSVTSWKRSFNIAQSSKHVVYVGCVLNDVLSRYDWQVLDNPTKDYDALVRGLLSCAEQAKLPRVNNSARITS